MPPTSTGRQSAIPSFHHAGARPFAATTSNETPAGAGDASTTGLVYQFWCQQANGHAVSNQRRAPNLLEGPCRALLAIMLLPISTSSTMIDGRGFTAQCTAQARMYDPHQVRCNIQNRFTSLIDSRIELKLWLVSSGGNMVTG